MRYRIGYIALLLLFSGCGGKADNGSPQPPIGSIILSPQQTTVALGQTLQMSAQGLDASGAAAGNVAVTWKSSDPSIATVDANGVVSGVNIGTATVEGSNGTFTATANIGVASPSPGAKDLTISGTAFYEDKPFTEAGFTGQTVQKPIRRAVINLIALDGFVTLSSGQTGEDGSYLFSNINNSARRGGVFVQILAKTADDSASPVTVRDSLSSQALLAVASNPLDDSVSASFTSHNIVASASQNGGAFNIIDTFLEGGEFVQSACLSLNAPCVVPSLKAFWKPGSTSGTFYESEENAIFILGGGDNDGDTDEYDDTILLHEYGHFIATQFSRDDSPGGKHHIDENDQDIRLAWSEGWATFFASAVRGSSLAIDTNAGGVSLVFDIENITSPSDSALSEKAVYTTSELSISSVLWDIFDAPTPTDDDPITTAGGFLPIWQVFTPMSLDIGTMEIFGILFIKGNLSAIDAIQAVLQGRKIELFPDATETGDGNTTEAQPLVVGVTQHHTLYKSHSNPFLDEDVISLSVEAGKRYTVKTLNLTNGADTFLTIAGATVASFEDNAPCSTGTDCLKNNATNLASSITFTAQTSSATVTVKRSPSAPLSAGFLGSYDILLTQE